MKPKLYQQCDAIRIRVKRTGRLMPSFKYVLEYLFEGEVIKTQEVDELYSGSAELTVTNINIMLDWEGH